MTEHPEFWRLDEVDIQISFGSHPAAPPGEVFSISIGNPKINEGESWNDAYFLKALTPILYSESGQHPDPYVLDVKKNHFSWGADGSGATILMYIASRVTDGAIGAATALAIEKAFRTLGGLSGHPARVLSREEAVESAKRRVSTAYKSVDSETLICVGEDQQRTTNVWVIALDDSKGNHYRVEISMLEGLPLTTRISRTAGGT
jgi:hypothetical protein